MLGVDIHNRAELDADAQTPVFIDVITRPEYAGPEKGLASGAFAGYPRDPDFDRKFNFRVLRVESRA